MDWKEFFKPELNKISILFVFISLAIIVTLSWAAPPPMWLRTIEPLLYSMMPFTNLLGGLGPFIFIVWIGYWYFVSCIIIALFRIIKK